jgi:tetratricopeptide (TPR) repeat protein
MSRFSFWSAMLFIAVSSLSCYSFGQGAGNYRPAALALVEQGQYREALDLLTQAVGVNAENPRTYATLSLLYRKVGECRLAWKYYEVAKDLKLDDAASLPELFRLCKEPKEPELKPEDLPSLVTGKGKHDPEGPFLWLPFAPEQTDWPQRAKLRLFPSRPSYWELSVLQMRKVRQLTGTTLPWVVLSTAQSFPVKIFVNKRDGWLMLLVPFPAPVTEDPGFEPAKPMPAPPAGFIWLEIPEVEVSLLKPEGWFLKREEAKDRLIYFISQEDIDKSPKKLFQTGMTIWAFHLKDRAVDFGKMLIDQTAATNHGETWVQQAGTLQEFGCRFKRPDPNGTYTIVHAQAVANPKNNRVYMFIFESPEPIWDSAWKTGKQIMDTLAIYDKD